VLGMGSKNCFCIVRQKVELVVATHTLTPWVPLQEPVQLEPPPASSAAHYEGLEQMPGGRIGSFRSTSVISILVEACL